MTAETIDKLYKEYIVHYGLPIEFQIGMDNFLDALKAQSAAATPDAEQLAEEAAKKVSKQLQDFGYVLTEQCSGSMEWVTKKVFIEMYQAGQSAVQDAPDSTTWKVLNNDKVNSILAIIMRICDEEQMIALKECLIRRTPAVQDATPQEKLEWETLDATDYKDATAFYFECFYRTDRQAKAFQKELSTLRSELSAAQEENKRLREALQKIAEDPADLINKIRAVLKPTPPESGEQTK